MQKRFLALYLLASVGIVSMQAMDDKNSPVNDEDGVRGTLFTVADADYGKSGNRTVKAGDFALETSKRLNDIDHTLVDLHDSVKKLQDRKDVESSASSSTSVPHQVGQRITASQIELLSAHETPDKKNPWSVREGFNHLSHRITTLEKQPKLSWKDTACAAGFGMLGSQWIAHSVYNTDIITSVAAPVGGAMLKLGNTVYGLKHALAYITPTVKTYGGAVMAKAAPYMVAFGAHAGLALFAGITLKTVCEVVSDFRNLEMSEFNKHWDAQNKAAYDASPSTGQSDKAVNTVAEAKKEAYDPKKEYASKKCARVLFFKDKYLKNTRLTFKGIAIGATRLCKAALS